MDHMLTPHEFYDTIHVPANYHLHLWQCTCGGRATHRARSRLLAELDWWGTHVLPDATPPAHVPTIVPGAFENAWTWRCSCGEEGEPGGFSKRWVAQSFTRHAHQRDVQWYQHELQQRLNSLTNDEYAAYVDRRERQKREGLPGPHSDSYARDPLINQMVVEAHLRELI